MDQVALGELAEQAAALADEGGPAAAGKLTKLIEREARAHHLAPWTLTSLIAREWDRLGIRRVPRGTEIRG